MKLEKNLEKVLETAGLNYEKILELSYEVFNIFAGLNDLDESRMFEFGDAGGVPIFCFDGTEDELLDMEMSDDYTIVVEELDTGAIRYVMVYDIQLFDWPIEITCFYIELKSELKEAGLL